MRLRAAWLLTMVIAGCGGEDASGIDFTGAPPDVAAEAPPAQPDATSEQEWVDAGGGDANADADAEAPMPDAPEASPDRSDVPPPDALSGADADGGVDVAHDRGGDAITDADATFPEAQPEPRPDSGIDHSDAEADIATEAEAATPVDAPVQDTSPPRDACPTGPTTTFDCGGVCGGIGWGCDKKCDFGAGADAAGFAAYSLTDLMISWGPASTAVCTNPCAPAAAPWSYGLDINVPLNNGQLDVPFCVRATSSGERRFAAIYGHPQPTADSGAVRAAYCDEGGPPTCLIAFGQPTNVIDERLRIIATATAKAPTGWTRYETVALVDGGCPLVCP